MRTTESILLLSLALILSTVTIDLHGQDISRSVVGNNGSYYSNLIFGDLHFTVGEIAVSQFENDITLEEGFHHSYYELVVDTKEIVPLEWAVKVYPNPTSEYIHIDLPNAAETQLFLYNSLGQLIIEKRFQTPTQDVDLNNLPAGTYWLRLSDDEGKQGSFQVQKISF